MLISLPLSVRFAIQTPTVNNRRQLNRAVQLKEEDKRATEAEFVAVKPNSLDIEAIWLNWKNVFKLTT